MSAAIAVQPVISLSAKVQEDNHVKMGFIKMSMFLLISILAISVFFSAAADENQLSARRSGRLSVWNTNSRDAQTSSSKPTYNSKTSFVSQMNTYLSTLLQDKEIAVSFHPAKTSTAPASLLAHPAIARAIDTSSQATSHIYVYQDDESPAKMIAHESFSASPRLSLQVFVDKMKLEGKALASDGKLDSFEVELEDADKLNAQLLEELNEIFTAVQQKIVYLVIEQPGAQAYAPQQSIDLARSLSESELSTLSSSTNTTGIYYSPEGCEFSIYYANTYLYITPDIFTGLMTSLFVAGVLLIGLSCLNAIQGASSFVMKPIPLGKEY
jgi:hypothetical protein